MLEILGKIGFDWQVALANLVNFIVIFLILKKFAFKPIFKVIHERQEKIDKGLNDAEKAEENLAQAEEIKKQKIQEAHQSANQIISQAQTKGDNIVIASQTDAEKSKKYILKDGEKMISAQKKKMESDLEREFSELVVSGVEKVMKENVDEETKNKMIEKSLSSFEFKS